MTEDVKKWQEALLTLPFSGFIDLMGNYLGKIQTPYNKHSLIEELTVFLRNEETQKRILSLIDSDDARILTAIHVFQISDLEDLFGLFRMEKTYLEIHYHLLNLEERLLIYRYKVKGDTRILMNPLLLEILSQDVLDSRKILSPIKIENTPQVYPWLNENLLIALNSFLSGRSDFLKTTGGLKKKIQDDMTRIFPGIINSNKLSLLVFTLIHMGLVRESGTDLIIMHETWINFFRLSPNEFYLNLWGAFCLTQGIDDESESLFQKKNLQSIVSLIHGILNFIGPDYGYTQDNLERITLVLCKREKLSLPLSPDRIIQGLLLLELFIPGSLHEEKPVYFVKNPGLSQLLGENQQIKEIPSPEKMVNGPPGDIVVQPNFEIAFNGFGRKDKKLIVGMISDITKYDIFPIFELTKETFSRGLKNKHHLGEIKNDLETLYGRTLPQNIIFSMDNWEKEYFSIRLTRGIILQVNQDRQYLVEHSEDLAPWIKEKIAPGIYILSPREEKFWNKALLKAGIEVLPEISHFEGPAEFTEEIILWNLSFNSHNKGEPFFSQELALGKKSLSDSCEFLDSLYSKVKRMGLSKETVEEVETKIKKKLILFEEQIRVGMGSKEKTEAKGLDYLGKVRLIEQTLKDDGMLLEVICRGDNGKPMRYLLKPKLLNKKGTQLIFIGDTIPALKPISIQVSKMSLVRKLKSSLYAL